MVFSCHGITTHLVLAMVHCGQCILLCCCSQCRLQLRLLLYLGSKTNFAPDSQFFWHKKPFRIWNPSHLLNFSECTHLFELPRKSFIFQVAQHLFWTDPAVFLETQWYSSQPHLFVPSCSLFTDCSTLPPQQAFQGLCCALFCSATSSSLCFSLLVFRLLTFDY